MSITHITTDDLRKMTDQEGLILMGCGGDPQEWLDGINNLLTDEVILWNGSKFENCFVFEHEDLWLYPDTLGKVRELYRSDGCKSKSEFIEKAVRYYVGHLTAEDDTSYLPNAFLSNMKSLVSESDTRHGRYLFKLAVEMAMMMMNILASMQDIDNETL